MKQEKSKKGLIGVLIAIIVLLLCVIGYLLFEKDMLNGKTNDNSTTTTTTVNDILCTKTVSIYNNQYSFVYKTVKSNVGSFDDIHYDIKVNNDYIINGIEYGSTAEYTPEDLKSFCLTHNPKVVKVESNNTDAYNYYVISNDGLAYGSNIGLYSVNSSNRYNKILDLSVFASTGWKKSGKDIPGIEVLDKEIFVVNNSTSSGINYPVGSRVKITLENGKYLTELVDSGYINNSGDKE